MDRILFLACMLFVGYASAKVVSFNECEDKTLYGKISQLEIIPCDVEPCALKDGTNVTMKVHFTPNEEVKDAKSVVHGKVAGFQVPFPIPNPEACHESGLTCPLKPKATVVYYTNLEVKTEYPHISTVVTWELQDSDKKDVFCFRISVHIT